MPHSPIRNDEDDRPQFLPFSDARLVEVPRSERHANRELDWTEDGISVLRLKRPCKAAGLGNFKRYFEGIRPSERGLAGFGRRLICLVAANFAFAPQPSIRLAAQKLSHLSRRDVDISTQTRV